MDWTKLLTDLKAAGMTQVQIAAECGVTQTSVSELFRGEIKNPSYDFGARLTALHTLKCMGMLAQSNAAA